MAPEIKSMFPNLKQHIIPTSSGSRVVCYTSTVPDTPILTLIHGYPQSAFIWRHIAPLLSTKISLFIPELPGYGVSTPCLNHDHSKRTVGTALLEALQSAFSIATSTTDQQMQKVILAGHDRGARICHRLAVDRAAFPALDILGAVLLDIIPTKAQWDAFANPAVCAGYFHWPLLANPDIAVPMLLAYGGGKWCRGALSRIAGPSAEGQARLASDNAADVYAALFEKEETLRGSCEDYAAGAAPEAAEQDEDQKAGRKITVPTLVMFSAAKLGARLDVAGIWRDWVDPVEKLEAIGVGNGYGHYLPEEAAGEVTEAMERFIARVA